MLSASTNYRISRRYFFFFLSALAGLSILYFTNPVKTPVTAVEGLRTSSSRSEKKLTVPSIEDGKTFDTFNNVTGVDHFIVPNIIHFIRFKQFELDFIAYVTLLAAMRNHKPDKFFFHTDIKDVQYTGKYWNLVQNDEDLWSRIEILYLEAPSEIFGLNLNEDWRLFHGSDIGRLRVLMEHGGIYLENDCFVIHSLDKYRKYEFVINWDEDQFLDNQMIIAHKDARFLPLWLDSYRYYRSDLEYYNAAERPTTEILYHNPELIHRVKGDFGADRVSLNIYVNPEFDWRSLDIIRLGINQRSYLDPHFNKTPIFDENNIMTYEYPFGDMAREILDKFNGSLD